MPIGKPKSDSPSDQPAAATNADGNEETGRPRFMMGTVFDISQTQEIEVAAAV